MLAAAYPGRTPSGNTSTVNLGFLSVTNTPLADLHRQQYNNYRQTEPPVSPVRSRSTATCATVVSLHPRSQHHRSHALIARYQPYHASTPRHRFRRHEREQQHTVCEQGGEVHFLTIRPGLQILEWAFGKRMTPAERLRKNQRSLDKAIRELDQVRVKLEKQEKTLVTQIRQSAQKNQMGAAKIQAKDLVRTRRYRRPPYR